MIKLKNIIINYAKNITEEDIKNFVKKNNFHITNKETTIIHNHIKTYPNELLKDPIKYIKMLKGKITDENYYNILMLFDKYRNLIGL